MADVAIPRGFRNVREIATPVCALARNDISLVVSVTMIRSGAWCAAFRANPGRRAADP